MKKKALLLLAALVLSLSTTSGEVVDDFEDQDYTEYDLSKDIGFSSTYAYDGAYSGKINSDGARFARKIGDFEGEKFSFYWRSEPYPENPARFRLGIECNSDGLNCGMAVDVFPDMNADKQEGCFQLDSQGSTVEGGCYVPMASNAWYKVEFDLTDHPNVELRMYNETNDLVVKRTGTLSGDSGNYMGLDQVDLHQEPFQVDFIESSAPLAPSINSISTDPESANLNKGDSVSISSNITDNLDSPSNLSVNATVKKEGLIVVKNQSMTYNGSKFVLNDAFSADEYETYDIVIHAEDTDNRNSKREDNVSISPTLSESHQDNQFIFFGNSLDFGLGFNGENELKFMGSDNSSLMTLGQSGNFWVNGIKLLDASKSEVPRSSIETERKQTKIDTSSIQSYTTSDEETVFIDSTSASSTITLATEDAKSGNKITIMDSGQNTCNNPTTIKTESSETINGQSQVKLTVDGESITIQWDGSEWSVIDHNRPAELC